MTVVHVERQPDGAPARRDRVARCSSVRSKRRACASRWPRRPRRSSATDRVRAVRFADGTRDRRGPRRDGGGRAPEHRARERRRACIASARSSSTTRCRPTIRASMPWANACSIARRRSVSSRRSGIRRACAGAHLAGAGHRRYVQRATATKLKVTGIDLYSAGDFIGGGEQRGPRAARSAPRHLQASRARRRAV